jgi:predicted extracellular nuclease
VLARRAALGSVAASVALVGLPAVATAAPPTTPFISEIHYDNAGGDVDEFVEVQLPPGTSSAGLSVVLYNGSSTSRSTYNTTALPAVTAPADAPAFAVVNPTSGIQNGNPDGVALVDTSTGTVLEFLSYGGSFVAANGPAAGQESRDIGLTETGSTPVGFSLSTFYDEEAGALVWYGPAAASKGAPNPGPDLDPNDQCPLTPTREIGEIQGNGAESAFAGTQATVRGVVVGDVPGLGGFYLQDGDGDGDGATSDGIFIESPVAVRLGDVVTLTGGVVEKFQQTQITSTEDVGICARDAALPASAQLDLPADDAARERFEGMLVRPADALTVSEIFDLTRFGELTLSEGGLLVQPTELARPGTDEAAAVADGNTLRRIVLDDGSGTSRSATNRPYLSPDTPVRVGDVLDFQEPLVLGYGFSQWRFQPADGTPEGVFAPQNTRPAAPDAVAGDVQIGAFNVLNYFVTYGGVGRGATSAAAHDRQAAKIVTAIEALGADVVTLMEIEDTDSTGYSPGDADRALADLVSRLNASAGSTTWAYVPLPEELYAVDRDVIRNGIIYQPAQVTPVGEPVGLVDEEVWDNAREPIAQTFVRDGDAFTVVANHFKSKNAGDDPAPSGDNLDAGDGQGSWNGDRVRQAESLTGFAEQLRASTGDQDVVLLGDFNAYTQEDPIHALREAGFGDLGESLDPGRYSYVFDDMSGSLDHALATAALAAKVTDLVHWNINAVESFSYQYTGDPALYAVNPFRSSDHDPLLLGLDLQPRCDGLVPTIVGTEGNDVIVGTNKRDVILGLGGNDVIRGGNGEDVICGGLGNDVVTADNGDDVVLGGFGNDWLSGGNGDDRLVGGPGQDFLDQGRGRGTQEQDGASS